MSHPDADRIAADLLAQLPEPAPGAEPRIRHALHTSLVLASRRKARQPLFAVAFVALAAGLVLAWTQWPRPAPTPLAVELKSGPEWQTLALSGDIHLSFSGTGTLGGTVVAPHIAWDLGTLNVEVEPQRGIDLTVSTREADVHVVGTGFSVTRDALGTRVDVLHGKVGVGCADGSGALLGGGASLTCLPVSAAALLGRARALATSGAPANDILATLDRALPLAKGGLADEVHVQRIEALANGGAPADALAEADAYLASGATLRRNEVRRARVELWMADRGCDGVRSELVALAAAADASDEDQHRLDACPSSPSLP